MLGIVYERDDYVYWNVFLCDIAFSYCCSGQSRKFVCLIRDSDMLGIFQENTIIEAVISTYTH